MNKNSTIQLKGIQGQLPITLGEARMIKSIWNDTQKAPGTIINIGKISFTKSDIKFVEEGPELNSKEYRDLDRDAFYRQEKDSYLTVSSWSPEKKSERLDTFKLLYRAAMDIDPTEEILGKVKEAQHDFFRMHPKRCECDLIILKKFVPKLNSTEEKFKNQIKISIVSLLEKNVYRDMQLAGEVQSIYVKEHAKHTETIPDMKKSAGINRDADAEYADMVKQAVANF